MFRVCVCVYARVSDNRLQLQPSIYARCVPCSFLVRYYQYYGH